MSDSLLLILLAGPVRKLFQSNKLSALTERLHDCSLLGKFLRTHFLCGNFYLRESRFLKTLSVFRAKSFVKSCASSSDKLEAR